METNGEDESKEQPMTRNYRQRYRFNLAAAAAAAAAIFSTLLTTRELKWHEEKDRPPYAILSHRWGDTSEEVTFQEFKSTLDPNPLTPMDSILSKSGYKKILEFCKAADSLKYDWVWVDTCCIDKASSSQLSEAINSMYRWYQQSAVCIAYLETVETLDANTIDRNSEFRQSQWFTRGWTLQELIAPRNLLFYNKSWARIGDRSRLAHAIEDVCGVPHELFSSTKKPYEYSIAQRMSWAAKRVTTRREDRAYCLLGLFEINMPLIYGEADAAFQRLQKKIMKKSNDQTIFAWGFCLPDELVLSQKSPRLTSILADSPGQFEECGDIVPRHRHSRLVDHSYRLAKEGIHMVIGCEEDLESSDKSRFVAFLPLCTSETQKTGICIRLQAYNVLREPVPYSTLASRSVFPLPNGSPLTRVMVGRIAGCRPLTGLKLRRYWSYNLPEAFFAIDPPYSLDQTRKAEEMHTVTISPYGTVIIPDSNGLTFTPLSDESWGAQIIYRNGYFAINKFSDSHQVNSPFQAFFSCSLAGHGKALSDSSTLYMMIDNRPLVRVPKFDPLSLDTTWSCVNTRDP
ncbi:hypothetical protein O1611_g2325 [Lasiodiplodia mahajangana]|uniref:Uncharacterized protein n=1 Tax=Lasiodiplodia mahajangana TaxID=1108764 RepID=A0ACC2JUV9_9PEZI|nr:hypothetical protein O1611_g2325 [Lasiodiplodia mahajangana]